MIWGKLTLSLLICLLAWPLLGMDAGRVAAKPTKTPKSSSGAASGNAYDVIAAVNQVRSANGLSPFEINGALMAAAQAHSDYQAATGSISHSGSGGSDPTSRAIAAGYGGGATVSVVENIYGGMNASPAQAVQWWQGDSLHLNTLLSTRHTEAGAGVSVSGGVVYYTLDVGSTSGSSSGSTGASVSSSAIAPVPAVAFNPILIATANPDGSIVHVVQAGQSLWSIAASYKIVLADLLQLNGFSDATLIYPGQKVLIKSAGEASVIRAPAGSGTPATPEAANAASQLPPTPTLASRKTDMPSLPTSPGLPPSVVPAQSPAAPPRSASAGFDPLLWIVAALVLGGTGLLLVGNILKRGSS